MKQPLLISCRGSEEVRSKCTSFLQKQIQSMPLQWRRNEAEFPIQIQLNVKFVAFSVGLIKNEDSRWQDVAAAHLYFLDCWDGEKYRLDIRSDLIEWFATLRDADTNDWFVVFDTCKARESKARGQVLEKLRSDLSKYANRIVEIDSVSYKMPILLRALADQMLTSFDYWAQSFEASLKAERDACFSLEWSFNDYMIIQIQYSSLLLSVGIFDQSLAQLDELDAMLSLLLSHYASSPSKARWVDALNVTAEPKELVSLISVYSHFDDTVRHFVRITAGVEYIGTDQSLSDQIGLRHLRALIFACQLSVIMSRHSSQTIPADTACQRIIVYGAVLLQAIRKEEAILTGVSDTDSPTRRLSNALWCLEVFHFAGQLCDLAVLSGESEAVCTIWMTLCRMIQRFDGVRTSSAAARLTKDWLASNDELPFSVLGKCLMDAAAFDEHFVKWHESALAMLKHYGWRRHARVIGIALADFYKQRGKDVDALHLLLKFARQLEEERWVQAYIGLLGSIADHQWVHCSLRERLKFFGDLSCANGLLHSTNSQAYYCEKFKNEFKLDWSYERITNPLSCPWFIIRRIRPDESSVLFGSSIGWSVTIDNKFPESLALYSASLCYSLSQAQKDISQRSFRSKKLADFRRESYSVASDISDCSDLYGIEMVCDSRILEPGSNVLVFQGKTSHHGLCSPEHLHFRLSDDGRLDVQTRVVADASSFCMIKAMEPEVEIILLPEIPFWAGITQTIKFRLTAGASPRKQDDIEDNRFRLEAMHSDLLFTMQNTGEVDEETNGGILLVDVPKDLSPGTSCEIDQTLFCNIHGSDESRTCGITAQWRGRTFQFQLQFKPIFHWISSLKVIGDGLFLTITLRVNSQRPLLLHDPKLTFASSIHGEKDVEAELLNDSAEQELYFGIPYTLAWNIPQACSPMGVIVFHYHFKDSIMDMYTCCADVTLQRPTVIEACCQMASEKVVCRVGMSCDFIVSLKSLDSSLRLVDVCVTLIFDVKFWSCAGPNTSELIQLKENGLGQAFFQVIPQCVGFLPMPYVDIKLIGEATSMKTCQAYVRSKGKQVHVLAALPGVQRLDTKEQGPRKPLEIGF